ncbi:MAG: alpha/beta hydrolase [Lacunisphaera sp.]|nr:alpha/beta hydrolase [Lacunisphaera sp.]
MNSFPRPLTTLLAFALLGLGVAASGQTPAAPGSMFKNMQPEIRAGYEAAGFRLWAERAPQAKGGDAADIPMLYPVLPPRGPAPVGVVLVLPGGGYNSHAAHEAFPIAEHFRAVGLAAFVLQYRLKPYDPTVSLLDAQRAVRVLRARAAEFGLDPRKIAAVGFSAGGHLAANLSTHADDGRPDVADPVERQGSRLQSVMLIYPSLVYARIKRDTADDRALGEILKYPGLHRNVGAKTPPTFLLVGYDDDKTPYEHCLAYATKLHEAGARFELHVLGTGGHGFGLLGRDPRLQIWGQLAVNWLSTCDILPAPPPAVPPN